MGPRLTPRYQKLHFGIFQISEFYLERRFRIFENLSIHKNDICTFYGCGLLFNEFFKIFFSSKFPKNVFKSKDGAVDPNHQVLLKHIYRLEKNLTWMGSYLETLSNTYKKQMDDVRTRWIFIENI